LGGIVINEKNVRGPTTGGAIAVSSNVLWEHMTDPIPVDRC